MVERFKVDLGGLVEILSRNLYSGPQVYVREIVQNAVDAIAARRALDPSAPALIRVEPWADGGGLTVTDTGVGLTAAEAEEFLATIGRSSKKDELFGESRSDFIGQFGIGLLACFLIADEVVITSRSAREGTEPIVWTGRADGTFELHRAQLGTSSLDAPGTRLDLRARPEARTWVDAATVTGLLREYASLLPIPLEVRHPDRAGEDEWETVTSPLPPVWERDHPDAPSRRAALMAHAERTFGFTPLDVIDLSVPLCGLSGYAAVLPQAVAPGSGRHRVHVRRMLVNAREDRLLPDWAFFVRAQVDAEGLTPTASREDLKEDEMLLLAREALGARLKQWIIDLVDSGTQRAERFLSTHHLALREMALTNDDMLDLTWRALPFETTRGTSTLAALAVGGVVFWTPTTEAYRSVAQVARAQGVTVVNGGYVYDADLLTHLEARKTGQLRLLQPGELGETLGVVDEARSGLARQMGDEFTALLREHDCRVIVKVFSPDSLPALLLTDEAARRQREIDRERKNSKGAWEGVLSSFSSPERPASRTLVLNDANATVQALSTCTDAALRAEGLRALFCTALLLAGEPPVTEELDLMHSSLHALVVRALGEAE